MTLVPLKVYFKDSLVKVEIGLAKERNYMTRGRISQRKTSKEKHKETLRSAISVR